MVVKHRQKTKNGCGSLSIANIFDDHRFTVGLEKLKGERINDLNRKLLEMGSELFIDTLFLTHKELKAGNRLKLAHEVLFKFPKKNVTKLIKEKYAVPYLLTIANSRGRNGHMVAALHSISDGLFHIIDSTKAEIKVMSYGDMIVSHCLRFIIQGNRQ